MNRKVATLLFSGAHLVGCLITIILLINTFNEMNEMRPEIPAEDALWQTVGGASHKFFVYSAYYESRENQNLIRIVGATKRNKSDPVFCRLWYPNATSKVQGQIEIIKEHHNLKYAACFIKCSLAGYTIPDSVSIVTENQLSPMNHLRVIDTRKYEKINQTSKTSGICVQPLHHTYNKTIQLVEFMELNRILGVDHVTFYNSSISPTTDCILRNYVDEGRATVLPWKDHFKSEQEILTENIIAALNDCLYRNMRNFSYLEFIDMDEFIMPAHHDTIQAMIQELEDSHNNNPFSIGSYVFRNAFFNLQWPDDQNTKSSNDVYEGSLTTLLKTRRTRKLLQHQIRSKYITKPTKVVTAGNHFVWKFVPDYCGFVVGPNHGILNHYRLCDLSIHCTYNRSITDRTAFRYKVRLVAAVKHRWQELQRRCGIEDIQRAKLMKSVSGEDLQHPTTSSGTSSGFTQSKTLMGITMPGIVYYNVSPVEEPYSLSTN